MDSVVRVQLQRWIGKGQKSITVPGILPLSTQKWQSHVHALEYSCSRSANKHLRFILEHLFAYSVLILIIAKNCREHHFQIGAGGNIINQCILHIYTSTFKVTTFIPSQI